MAITSAFQADDAGSIPAARSIYLSAVTAQQIEHTFGKGEIPIEIWVSAPALKQVFPFDILLVIKKV